MKTFLLAFAVLFCITCTAQTAAPTDTLIWNDGTIYYGKLEKKGGSELRFRTQDGQLHYVSLSSVAQVKLSDGSGDALKPKVAVEPVQAVSKPKPQPDPADAAANQPPVNWKDTTLPRDIVRKHRTGVGLAVTGAGLVVAGIGMLAAGLAQNGQTTTVSNGYSTQTNVSVGAVGGVGILCFIAGLPMTIVGGVKAGKAKRMARARQIHLN